MAKLYIKKSDGTYVPQKSQSVTNIDIVQQTGDSVTAAMSQDAVTKGLAKKANTSHEHTVAQITDMPAIPSKTSELANDSGYVTEPTVMAHTDAEVTITLTPNVIHHITGATAITVSSVADTFKECFLQFVSGESAPTLTMPEAIKWAGGQAPTLEANMTYQISVVKLCAVCVGYKEVANEQA